MAIHETLRQLRKAHGWSQEKMAEELNLSTNGYARLERGERKLDFEKLQQIAMLFKIDIAQLVEAENKGLVVQQTLSFQSEAQDNNKNYASDKDLAFEIEKLNLIVQHQKELIAQKDSENEILKTLVANLQSQLSKP